MADSIETKEVRPSEWTVESLTHSIHSKTDSFTEYSRLYKTKSTFVFAALSTCADIKKKVHCLCNEYKNLKSHTWICFVSLLEL